MWLSGVPSTSLWVEASYVIPLFQKMQRRLPESTWTKPYIMSSSPSSNTILGFQHDPYFMSNMFYSGDAFVGNSRNEALDAFGTHAASDNRSRTITWMCQDYSKFDPRCVITVLQDPLYPKIWGVRNNFSTQLERTSGIVLSNTLRECPF